jgi:aminomethyltransferase
MSPVWRSSASWRWRPQTSTACPSPSPAPATPARTASRSRSPASRRKRSPGLCLYGHDIDETTSPIEAGLAWTIGKRRRAEGGFPGADRVAAELRDGPKRKRVGIRPEGRAPAREGAAITDGAGRQIGTVTSGGYGPTLGAPIAMGYVEPGFAAPGTRLALSVRGQDLAAATAPMPFVPHRYKR